MTITIFESVPDYRKTGMCIYKLSELLTIALLTYICNGEDYQDMHIFAKTRARDFGLLQDCGDHSPSPDTFERMMKKVDTEALERCLIESGRQFLDSLKEKQIAIDGKKLRGTNPKSRGTKGDYILNAYVTENHIMIGQQKLEDKENEITAIPQLIDKIAIEGATVSIDAIGTQTNIAQQIVDRDAHYFLAVKENQKRLYEEVIDAFRLYKPTSEATETETGHGRKEKRVCSIMSAQNIEDKEVLSKWCNLNTLIRVTSEVTQDGETSVMTRYFISDDTFPKAKYYNMVARGHWGIENQLHWLLDVAFMEDNCRARKDFSAQNLSTIRKLALQMVKTFQDKKSIRKRLYTASLNPNYMLEHLLNVKI